MKPAEIIQIQQEENALLKAQNAQMAEQNLKLQQQVDWFKRQIFGSKSEKQIVENPFQKELFHPEEKPTPKTGETPIKAHIRRSNKNRSDNDVNDTGLRFDESVPQKIIEIPAAELQGDDAEHFEIIDYKETVRLAQQPGSYTVLIYRQPVVRNKKQQTIKATPAPSNVLEGCYADVSLLAGMMVDKAIYHLPLHRQHQRLLDSGVRVSRSSLLNWIQKGIEQLKPIYQAQWRHILQSKVLAMDEVPIKAGRKSKGKMKQTYYWPIFGEGNEVAFTWSPNRGHAHVVEQLTGFSGTLLTDGYAAYDSAINKLISTEGVSITHANCWAHSRRKFENCSDMEPEASQQALAIIGAIYNVEERIRDQNLPADQTLAYRQKYSEPLVNEFFTWVYCSRSHSHHKNYQ